MRTLQTTFSKHIARRLLAFPVHLTIRLYDPIHGLIQYTYSTACHCLGNLPRRFRAFVAADTIVQRQKFKRVTIIRVHIYILHNIIYTYVLNIICIDDRRKHTFLSPTDTGFFF